MAKQAAQKTAEAAAEWVDIGALKPWADNPRINDAAVAKVVESIKRFGFGAPIVARRADGEIIAGHTRLKAAQALGLDRVPVRWMDLDPADAHLLAIADNKISGDWHNGALADALSDYSLEDAELAGWTSDEIEKLADEILLGSGEGGPPEDDVPEPPANPVTNPGDLWVLGEHRILCGDSRNPDDVARLIGDERVNVAFTSPPYASQRKYDEDSGFTPIHPDDYLDWWDAVQACVKNTLADDGSFFVNIKPASDGLDCQLYVLDLVCAMVRRWGWHFATELCWERLGLPGKPGRRFKNQFEPVYQFAKGDWKFRPEAVKHESGAVPRYDRGNQWSHGLGDDTAGTRGSGFVNVGAGLAYPGNRLSIYNVGDGGHPAVFPAELPAFFLEAYSDPDDVVFDPFSGSGSTVVAAEKHSRRGRGMEISPGYVDVAVARWENLTGGKAQRGSS